MSKKKGGFVIHLDKMEIVKARLRDGYALNQHSATMRDQTKYVRKPKHRRDFREERDAPVFLFIRILG
jgi:hypothetical protein